MYTTSKTNKLQWWIKFCVTGWCFYNFGGINSLLDGNCKKGNLWTKENNLLSIVYSLTPFSFRDLNLLLLPVLTFWELAFVICTHITAIKKSNTKTDANKNYIKSKHLQTIKT